MKRRKVWEGLGLGLLGLAAGGVMIVLGGVIGFLILKGGSALSWEFLTSFPRRGMSEGGIFPALVGTGYLVLGTVILTVPLGVGAAV